MFLEKLWPHLPTPLVNAFVLLEAALVYFYSNNYTILSFIFIGILTLAFIIGSIKGSQPFHFERLAVLITLAFINVSILAQHMAEFNEFLHLHTAHDIFMGRVVYALIWFLLFIVAIIGYFYNVGQPVTRAWPLLTMITLLATMIPLEPESFIMNQSPWLWISRVALAVVIFTLVTVGDTTNVTTNLYLQRLLRQREHRQRQKSAGVSESPPVASDVDLPIARTVIWMPLTLWVIFVPKVFIFLALFLALLLARSLVIRWQRVTAVHLQFSESQTLLAHVSQMVGLNRIIDVVDDIESQTLNLVRQYLEEHRLERKRSGRDARLKDDAIDTKNEQLVIDMMHTIARDPTADIVLSRSKQPNKRASEHNTHQATYQGW